jgi:hypothetical protein
MTAREGNATARALRTMRENNAAIVMLADAGDEIGTLAGRVVTLRAGRLEG